MSINGPIDTDTNKDLDTNKDTDIDIDKLADVDATDGTQPSASQSAALYSFIASRCPASPATRRGARTNSDVTDCSSGVCAKDQAGGSPASCSAQDETMQHAVLLSTRLRTQQACGTSDDEGCSAAATRGLARRVALLLPLRERLEEGGRGRLGVDAVRKAELESCAECRRVDRDGRCKGELERHKRAHRASDDVRAGARRITVWMWRG